MTPGRLLFDYTSQILAYRLGDPPAPAPIPEPAEPERLATRVLTAWRHSGRERLLLLGCGSGRLVSELTASLPPQALFAVSEPEPERLRRLLASGRLPPLSPDHAPAMLADTSPLAHLCLWRAAGLSPQTTFLLLNPELPPARKAELAPLAGCWPIPALPAPRPAAGPLPSLAAAAILSPNEPDLAGFLGQFPATVSEIVCFWDGAPPANLPPDSRRRDLSRPLDGDFGAQRTALLEAVRADWVLMLDADERLPDAAWAALPALLGPDAPAGYLFPRLTLYPDAEQALVGYGLWPDAQLRLFARGPEVRFAGRVHERLTGLDGPLDLLPDLPILHLQRLRKSPEDLREKLAGFDRAGGPGTRHVLSADYPRLPLSFFPGTGGRDPRLSRLRLSGEGLARVPAP